MSSSVECARLVAPQIADRRLSVPCAVWLYDVVKSIQNDVEHNIIAFPHAMSATSTKLNSVIDKEEDELPAHPYYLTQKHNNFFLYV